MHRLELLGGVELRDATGTEVRGVIAQPKRLALLAYLCVNSSTHPVRRDGLLTGRLDEAKQVALADARQATGAAASFRRGLAVRYPTPGREAATRAYLAAWMGDKEGALRFLEQARQYGQAEHRFVHREPAFAFMRDYVPFQRFLKPRG